MYLIRKGKARVKHIWNGEDTRCRMASTNGLNLRRYQVVEQSGLRLCQMCRTNARKVGTPNWEQKVAAAKERYRERKAAEQMDIELLTNTRHLR